MSDHEDGKHLDKGVDPLLMLSIGNEIRKEVDRAVDKIETKIDSVRGELKEDVNEVKEDVKRLEDRLDKRLLKVEARTSSILGLLSVIGIGGGILLFLLRAGGG